VRDFARLVPIRGFATSSRLFDYANDEIPFGGSGPAYERPQLLSFAGWNPTCVAHPLRLNTSPPVKPGPGADKPDPYHWLTPNNRLIPPVAPQFDNNFMLKSVAYNALEEPAQPGAGCQNSGSGSSCGSNDPRPSFWDALQGVGPLPRRDPLILDLDGDGVETTTVESHTAFDYDGDGFAEFTGWVAQHDGLLVVDRNADGIINDGRELFGDQTILRNGTRAADGFQALAEFDENHDGKIDANDAAFAQLRVWQDMDGDGYSLADELQTLDDVGIGAINLESTYSPQTGPHRNTQVRVGSFERIDGSTGQMAEYNLQRAMMCTVAKEWVDVPEDVGLLPDLQGFGSTYDLHQAIVRDSTGVLKLLVEQFVSTNDAPSRAALMEQILFQWTGAQTVNSGSRGGHIDARRLVVLERFFGQSFVGTDGPDPNYSASILLNKSYRQLFEAAYAGLMAQSHLKDLYSKIIYTWNDQNEGYDVDLGGLIGELQTQLANKPEDGKQLLSEFARTMRGAGVDPRHCLPCRELFIQQDPSLGWVIDTGGLPVFEHLHQGVRTWSPHIDQLTMPMQFVVA